METIINNSFNWGDFLTATLVLVVIWFLLNFLGNILGRAPFLGKYQTTVVRSIKYLVLLFEPSAIAVLVSIFILINPLFHGLVFGWIFLTGFYQIQNYFNGLVVRFNNNLIFGKKLSSNNLTGIISKMDRSGIQLKTDQGLHFISYSNLLKEGYMLVSGEEIGGLYNLKITPFTKEDKTNQVSKLKNLIITAPYVDWNHKPEFKVSGEEGDHVTARILLKDESHLNQFIALINEWGYVCSTINKN
jgi:hypothetical protein